MVDKIISERGGRLEFLTVQDEAGKDFFAYLLMSEANYPKYLEAKNSGMINPDEYGVVFAYGEGKEAPEELQEKINSLFNNSENINN